MKERCSNCYYRLLAFSKNTRLHCSKHKKTKRHWGHCTDWISVEEVHERIRKGVGKHTNTQRKGDNK